LGEKKWENAPKETVRGKLSIWGKMNECPNENTRFYRPHINDNTNS